MSIRSFNIMHLHHKTVCAHRPAGSKAAFRLYQSKASQGKQSIRTLVRQNRGVSSVEISKTGIQDLDRYAKRYRHRLLHPQGHVLHVPPRYMVFFKAQDTDALSAAFKEYSASLLIQTKRPSVLAKLHDLVQAALQICRTKCGTRNRSAAYEHEKAFQAAGALSALCGMLGWWPPTLAKRGGWPWAKNWAIKSYAMMDTLPAAFANPLPSSASA